MANVVSRPRLVLSTDTPEECRVICLSGVLFCMLTMYTPLLEYIFEFGCSTFRLSLLYLMHLAVYDADILQLD